MPDPHADPTAPVDDALLAVLEEYHDQIDRGLTVDQEAFAASHPELSDAIRAYFQDLQVVEKMAGPTAASAIEGTVITSDTQNASLDQTFLTEIQQTASPGTPDRPPLKAFGRYRILKELGRGAMGAVYLAKDEQLHREVALKIPQFDQNADPGLLERFYREARSAAALQHPGICPVFDVGEIDGQHYITMACIKGRPLRDFTKSSKRQEGKQVARVIRKIAQAMAEAHEHNVIHRDLKPANVMMNLKNEPVVMDFGLARCSTEGEERLTHTGTIIGTPAYMSPEQVAGDQDAVGAASDVYSLGVIFYELLTGRLPFQGNLMSILHQISTKEPQPPRELHDDIDPFLQDLCLQMLSKDQLKRPASMQKVADDLTAWLSGRRVTVDETVELDQSRSPASGQSPEEDDPTALQTAPATSDFPATVTEETETVASRRRRPSRETSSPAAGKATQVPPWKNPQVLLAALGGAAVLLAGIAFIVRLGKYDVQITLDDRSMSLKVDGETVVIEGDGSSIRLSAGPHKLHVEMAGFATETGEFTVRKNGKNSVHVAILDRKLVINPPEQAATPASAVASTTKPVIGSPRSSRAPPLAVAPFDAAQAKQHQQAWADYLGLPVEKEVELPGGEKLTMVLIPPGEFLMGSSDEERTRLRKEAPAAGERTAVSAIQAEGPQHRVRITRPFYLGKYEVTQAQWQSVMKANPSKIKGNLLNPVEHVIWSETQTFLTKLNEGGSTEKMVFALPTEAQWEYACRAGTTTRYYFGETEDDLRQYAWFKVNSGGKPHPVGELKPNAFGLFDMHGNVSEWCRDPFSDDYYSQTPVDDPAGPTSASHNVTRGSDFHYPGVMCRSARRNAQARGSQGGDLGFRLAASINADALSSVPATPGTTAGSTSRANAPPLAVAPFDAAQAKQHQQAWADYLGLPVEKEVELPGGEKLTMVLIPPGEFLMGSSDEEIERLTKESTERLEDPDEKHIKGGIQASIDGFPNESQQHRVTISRAFYCSKYEFTQAQWQAVMGGNPTPKFKGPNLPVEVSWDGIQPLLTKLNLLPLSNGLTFTLPSEAQWEYACRAGTDTAHYWGESDADLQDYAWCAFNSKARSHPVGGLLPNAWGLHDVYGNIAEWCADYANLDKGERYDPAPITDPAGPESGVQRRIRGGAWGEFFLAYRSAYRTGARPTLDFNIGFRLAAVIWDPKAAMPLNLDIQADVKPSSGIVGSAGSANAPPLAVAPFDEVQAKQHQQAWADYLGLPVEKKVDLGDSVTMTFELIPPGEFIMGSIPADVEQFVKDFDQTNPGQARFVEFLHSEAPQHRVRITKPFYLGKNEVTVSQFRQFVQSTGFKTEAETNGAGSSGLVDGKFAHDPDFTWATPGYPQSDDHPVVHVSQTDSLAFCQWLTQKHGEKAGLPTEAQWEYACRAGTTTTWLCGDSDDTVDAYAWTGKNRRTKSPQPVGELQPNGFGLFDISGNVMEWCHDWYAAGPYSGTPEVDPTGPRTGKFKITRGGCWNSGPRGCRSAYRDANPPFARSQYLGFRATISIDAAKLTLGATVGSTTSANAPPPAVAPFDAAQAKQHQQAWADYLGLPVEKEVELPGGEKMVFMLIPPGEFTMGSSEDEERRFRENPDSNTDNSGPLPKDTRRPVRITRPFYLGKTEVTVAQWRAVMGTDRVWSDDLWPTESDHVLVEAPTNSVSPELPVGVMWRAAVAMAERLNEERSRTPGDFGLPTEAQWEYAARAGTTTAWFFGDSPDRLGEYAWFNLASSTDVRPVGQLKPNPWGLHDVYGNAVEWCSDPYIDTAASRILVEDPVVARKDSPNGVIRVLRGGGQKGDASNCRSASRISMHWNAVYRGMGFRLAMSIDTAKLELKSSIGRQAENVLSNATAGSTSSANAPSLATAPFDETQAKTHQKAWADYLGLPVEKEITLPGGEKLTMVLIPPGEFLMGSTAQEQARFLEEAKAANDQWIVNLISIEGPQHRVRITRPFWLSRYEVTIGQFRQFADASDYKTDAERNGKGGSGVLDGQLVQAPQFVWNGDLGFPQTDSNPVIEVSWNDATACCQWLSQQQNGLIFRLPTEAEWEYACRAGTTSPYYSGESADDLRGYGWSTGNSGKQTHPVGQLKSNAFGLYDMHGNAWEWCADWYAADYYVASPFEDPRGPLTGRQRMFRGGSWYDPARHSRVAHRSTFVPDAAGNNLGFRLAASIDVANPTTDLGPAGTGAYALQFNGKDSYVTVPSLLYDGSHPITMEAWVRVDNSSSQPYTQFLGWSSVFVLSWQPNGRFECAAREKPEGLNPLPGKLRNALMSETAKSIQHVAGVWDGENLRLFVNGKASPPTRLTSVLDVSKDPKWQKNNFSIGCAIPNWPGAIEQKSHFLNGTIDEIRISKTARYTKDFIPERNFARDADCMALYHFDEGQGDKLVDSSGNGHDGKIIAATWDRTPQLSSPSARWQPTASQQVFIDQVATFPADEQVREVARKLQEINPGFDGKYTHKVEAGKVVEFHFATDQVTEIWPVRVLQNLTVLDCVGSPTGRGKLASLSALAGMPLTTLRCKDNPGISDLTPVAGMPLLELNCENTSISDLSPLTDMQLTALAAAGTKIIDLSPLTDMRLTFLTCYDTQVSDLTPLAGMPLGQLSCTHSRVTDLTPLKGAPLWACSVTGTRIRDLSPLTGSPAKHLNCDYTLISDLEPLATMKLETLGIIPALFNENQTRLLRSLPVKSIGFFMTPKPPAEYWGEFEARRKASLDFAAATASLSAEEQFRVLQVKLGELNAERIEFSPVIRDGVIVEATMTLPAQANVHLRKSDDITPLRALTGLKKLTIVGGPFWLDLSPINVLPVEELTCSQDHVIRNAAVLRGMTTLRLINGKPAADALQEAVQPAQPPSATAGSPRSADTPRPAVAPFDEAQAKAHQKAWADHLGVPIEYTNSVGMKFRLIPPGEFLMGSTTAEAEAVPAFIIDDHDWHECIKSEVPQHRVRLTQPFYLGVHEVTQAEYESVMHKNPSHFASLGAGKDAVAGLDTAAHPVESVSWNDAAEFCARLSEKEKVQPAYSRRGETVTELDGTGYRLPTEAQWEFTCRVGTTTRYWTSDSDEDLSQAAWIGKNSDNRTHTVGERKANGFGLYDVHGNVLEWVQDRWEPNYYGQFQDRLANDPVGPSAPRPRRVMRGGCYFHLPYFCRSASRFAIAPMLSRHTTGFRVSLSVDAVKDALNRRPATALMDKTDGQEALSPVPLSYTAEAKQQRWKARGSLQ